LNHDHLEDLYAALDPLRGVDDTDIFTPGQALVRLHREIAQSQPARRPKRPRRRRFWRKPIVVSMATVFVLAGTAGAISLLRSPVQDVSTLGCYQKIALNSNIEIVPYSSNPLAACASIWHWKQVPGRGIPGGSLCILTNGSLAGFPPSRRGHTCARLGLPTFNGKVMNAKVAQFQAITIAYFVAHSCVSPSSAAWQVRTLVGRYGLTGWRVSNIGSSDPRSCAFPAFHMKDRTVDVVGNPVTSTTPPRSG
jgi:hypothetical protein